MTRCHECDRPVATQEDHDRCESDCLCERCTSLCWVNWGHCTGEKVDWRARALKAEAITGSHPTVSGLDIDQLERVARAARPGPWQWYGNTKMNEVYLATVHGGRVLVMDFARWGMVGAQPRFQVDQCMTALGDLGKAEHPMGPRFEASHRRQFSGIGHPDAEHIAANSPDVTLALTGRIRELEAKLAGMGPDDAQAATPYDIVVDPERMVRVLYTTPSETHTIVALSCAYVSVRAATGHRVVAIEVVFDPDVQPPIVPLTHTPYYCPQSRLKSILLAPGVLRNISPALVASSESSRTTDATSGRRGDPQ